MIKVQHDRENCIGCGACVAIAPDFWSMGDDGKVNLKGAEKKNGVFELKIEEKDVEQNKNAAETCPANVIHVLENDKKLV